MPPIKTKVRKAIEDSILAMRVSGGFNYDWTSNNRDLALSTFPNFYVRMPIETNLDFDTQETNFQSYDNAVEVEILVITKNDSSAYDPQRIGEDELDLAEDDLKKLFGDSGQVGSPLADAGGDQFYYMGSETTYYQSNDIFTPEQRIFKFRLQYTQDRLNPEQIAC